MDDNAVTWTAEQDNLLCDAHFVNANNLEATACALGSVFTPEQCRERLEALRRGDAHRRGSWGQGESGALRDAVQRCTRADGRVIWREVAALIPGRVGKQCRERWVNHLKPGLRKCKWTAEEDRRLRELVAVHGRSWTLLSEHFNGRPENAIKNRWGSLCVGDRRREAAHAAEYDRSTTSKKRRRSRPVAPPLAPLAPFAPLAPLKQAAPPARSPSPSLETGAPASDHQGLLRLLVPDSPTTSSSPPPNPFEDAFHTLQFQHVLTM